MLPMVAADSGARVLTMLEDPVAPHLDLETVLLSGDDAAPKRVKRGTQI